MDFKTPESEHAREVPPNSPRSPRGSLRANFGGHTLESCSPTWFRIVAKVPGFGPVSDVSASASIRRRAAQPRAYRVRIGHTSPLGHPDLSTAESPAPTLAPAPICWPTLVHHRSSKAAQLWSKFVASSPSSAHICRNLLDSGPNLAEVRPTSVDIGPDFVQAGRACVEFGWHRQPGLVPAAAGPNLAEFRHAFPKIGGARQVLATIGPTSADSGPKLADSLMSLLQRRFIWSMPDPSRQVWPSFCQPWPNLAKRGGG